MKHLRAYKYRIYPTAKQRKQLAKEFGCARVIWNKALELRTSAWTQDKTRHNYVSLSRVVTAWKDDLPWLREATASCLTQVLIDQDKAFQHFFRRVKAGEKPGYPKFKSKHGKQAVRYCLDQRRLDAQYQAGKLLKLPKLGAVKVKWSRLPIGTPKMVTVSKDTGDRYFVSFSCEEEIDALPLTGKAAGVDLGVKDVVVTSDGYKSGNPKHLKARLRHLKRQQRRLSRMTKGSNRRAKQKRRVAKIHAKIANSRADFLHKTTTKLIQENDAVALEDLNVKGMTRNPHMASAVNDVGMHELRRQIEYKARWYGRHVEVIDRWAPTSKMCHECGAINENMPKGLRGLRIRDWTCACGAHHDRDVNGAKNILKFSTLGNRGIDARGQGKNLPVSAGTLDESRTEAEQITVADRLERAA